MNKKNRKCLCCSTEYFYCPSCSESNKPSWMIAFHDERCKDVFQTVTDYNYGLLSKDKAKENLSKYELKDISVFNDDIRRVLAQIFEEEVPVPAKVDESAIPKSKKRAKARQEESVG